jgi:hypothetical protein
MPFRLDRFRIDRHEFVGARLRVDGYLSRTGVQIYDQGDGTQQREQRDASEVFDPASLRSMRAMPVTIQHPPLQMLDATNWRDLANGHVGDDVRKAEDGIHTKASIWILDATAQEQITSGQLCELSVGYYADLDETPGTNDKGEKYDARQIQIRGNHLALLHADQARGGPGCRLRLDSKGDARYDDPATDPIKREKRKMKLKIRADGYDHEVESESDSLAVALEKERTKQQEILDSRQENLDQVKAKLDAEIEKTKELEAKLATATDPKAMKDAVAAADQFEAAAIKVAGKEIDLTGDPSEIRKVALVARGVDVEGKSDAYIEARFDAYADVAEEREDHLGNARKKMAVDPAVITDKAEILNLTDALAAKLAGSGGE